MQKREQQTIFGLHDRDLLHHLLLLFGMFIGCVFFFLATSNISKFFIGIIMAGYYVAWGYIHHTIDGDLHGKNVVEYVLIALLGLLILGGFLL